MKLTYIHRNRYFCPICLIYKDCIRWSGEIKIYKAQLEKIREKFKKYQYTHQFTFKNQYKKGIGRSKVSLE